MVRLRAVAIDDGVAGAPRSLALDATLPTGILSCVEQAANATANQMTKNRRPDTSVIALSIPEKRRPESQLTLGAS